MPIARPSAALHRCVGRCSGARRRRRDSRIFARERPALQAVAGGSTRGACVPERTVVLLSDRAGGPRPEFVLRRRLRVDARTVRHRVGNRGGTIARACGDRQHPPGPRREAEHRTSVDERRRPPGCDGGWRLELRDVAAAVRRSTLGAWCHRPRSRRPGDDCRCDSARLLWRRTRPVARDNRAGEPGSATDARGRRCAGSARACLAARDGAPGARGVARRGEYAVQSRVAADSRGDRRPEGSARAPRPLSVSREQPCGWPRRLFFGTQSVPPATVDSHRADGVVVARRLRHGGQPADRGSLGALA